MRHDVRPLVLTARTAEHVDFNLGQLVRDPCGWLPLTSRPTLSRGPFLLAITVQQRKVPFKACSPWFPVHNKKTQVNGWVFIFKREPTMRKFLADFVADESGATAIEYGLIAAGIAIALSRRCNRGYGAECDLGAAATASTRKTTHFIRCPLAGW